MISGPLHRHAQRLPALQGTAVEVQPVVETAGCCCLLLPAAAWSSATLALALACITVSLRTGVVPSFLSRWAGRLPVLPGTGPARPGSLHRPWHSWSARTGQGWARLGKAGQGWARLGKAGQGWARLGKASGVLHHHPLPALGEGAIEAGRSGRIGLRFRAEIGAVYVAEPQLCSGQRI